MNILFRESDGERINVDNALAESYDTTCKCFTTITNNETRVNEGRLFSATHLFTGVADSGVVRIVGITGDNSARLLVIIKATGEAEIEFEKGTTFTDNGTEIDAFNRNENSTNTPTTKIYHTPTVDESGTVFSEDLIPGGGQKNASIGGESSLDLRYVISANSNHLLKITNTSGAEQKIFVKFVWVE